MRFQSENTVFKFLRRSADEALFVRQPFLPRLVPLGGEAVVNEG